MPLNRMEQDDKTLWNQKYSEGSHKWLEPDPLLEAVHEEFLSDVPPGTALDVAGGVGRHALWLAQRRWRVKLVDVSDVGIGFARKNFEKHLLTRPGLTMPQTQLLDLNSVRDLGAAEFDLILVFFFLQRELFPALISAIKPGGFLIYKTYTVDQQKFKGGPSHPMFLLQPNELLHAFSSLRILHYHERTKEKGVAELVARKSA
jgi:tellurite methyltransferase